jgi:hypothetical protein
MFKQQLEKLLDNLDKSAKNLETFVSRSFADSSRLSFLLVIGLYGNVVVPQLVFVVVIKSFMAIDPVSDHVVYPSRCAWICVL